MNVFHCSEKLGKSTAGVNDRYRHVVIYMPSVPIGTRFKYRRIHTLTAWNSSVDVNNIDPHHRFQRDDAPSMTFLLFSRCREYKIICCCCHLANRER